AHGVGGAVQGLSGRLRARVGGQGPLREIDLGGKLPDVLYQRVDLRPSRGHGSLRLRGGRVYTHGPRPGHRQRQAPAPRVDIGATLEGSGLGWTRPGHAPAGGGVPATWKRSARVPKWSIRLPSRESASSTSTTIRTSWPSSAPCSER